MNLISFSLFGSHPFYCVGAVRNAELAKTVYPGWRVRFYVRKDVPESTCKELEAQGAEVIHMPITQLPGPMGSDDAFAGTFWRFIPVSENKWEHVLIRDTDSRLNIREKAAVDDWIVSGKSFHSMLDHPKHMDARYPFMAGMWGAKGGLNSLFRGLLFWPNWFYKQADQDFLNSIIWPLAKNEILIHGGRHKPFPAHEVYNGFVGEYVDEFEKHWGDQHPLEVRK